ncbi:MAG TPA: FadR/GntR family transcriptional regulator, partial [Acidimicrobiia bacterium]
VTTRGSGTPDTGIYSAMPRSTLGERIALQILNLIRTEELRPGDQLPPERDLAKLLGVSRPVVREALRALSIMRVVEIRQGAGTFVTSLEPQQLISHLDFVFPRDRVALLKLLEARRIIEVGNVRLAAERATETQLIRLEDLVARLETSIHDEQDFRALDIEFHHAICEAADNFLMTQFMKIADTLGEISREETGSSPDVRKELFLSHRSVLDAVRSGDPDRAESAMAEHLDRVEERLREIPAG